jgi:steroid 5-alpha reductase family enzyme
MTVWFVVSLLARRNDVADVAWGLGFVLLAWISFLLSGTGGIRAVIVVIMVTIWGLRLAWHIHTRNRGKIEDYRYIAWRDEWGKWFYIRSFLQVYLLQGALLYLILFPVLIINKNIGNPFTIVDFIGILLWIVGFCFESIGDWQLSQFLKDPTKKGTLMQSGLWKYSRHPNYFGEVLGWWGIFILALGVPFGWIGIIGPLTITVLILKVSGIPLLEKKMEQNINFATYKRQTNIFIPWFPREKFGKENK